MLKFQLFAQKGRNKREKLPIPIYFNHKIYLYIEVMSYLVINIT